MPYRIGVRPSKAASLIGMLAGGIFVVLGLTVIVPIFGAFGVVWTCVAALITLFYAFNFFSAKGVSTYEIDVGSPNQVEDLDAGLRKLAKLKEDGLISEEEHARKRAELMGGSR
jgi:hypothetical protein